MVQPIEVVSLDGVTGYSATLTTIPLFDGEEARTVALPGVVRVNELFCVRLDALRGSDHPVPVSRRDIAWQVLGDEAVSGVATDHASEPLGTLFIAGSEPGSVELVAEIGLLGESVSFALDVTP